MNWIIPFQEIKRVCISIQSYTMKMTMTTMATTTKTEKRLQSRRLNGESPSLGTCTVALVMHSMLLIHHHAQAFHIPRTSATRSSSREFQFQKPFISISNGRSPRYYFAQPKDDHHPEMAFERESPGIANVHNTGDVSDSITPKRAKKHKNRKKKMRRGRNTAEMKSGPLSIDELALHVSNQYVSGAGGLFRQADAKRKRVEAASLLNGRASGDDREQVQYLRKLDRHPTLVLNADYQPLSVLPLSLWSWQDTVKALFSGKVRVVETYPEIIIRAVNMDVPLPSVIALTEYVQQPNDKPAFTRRNVFLRDGYKCQYCAKMYRTNDLSLDHVTPRCVGGKLEWENAVTCCKKCNSRKGSTLPKNLRSVGMKLIREPRVPTKYELASEAGKMVPRRVHPTWTPYLGVGTTVDEGSKDSRNYFEEDA